MLTIFHWLPILNLTLAGFTIGVAGALLLGTAIRRPRPRWLHRGNVILASSDIVLASLTLLPAASPMRSPWTLITLTTMLAITHVWRGIQVHRADRPVFAPTKVLQFTNTVKLAGWIAVLGMTLALHFALIAPPRRDRTVPAPSAESVRTAGIDASAYFGAKR